MNIVVGSKNPIKIEATREAFMDIMEHSVNVIKFKPQISIPNTPTSIKAMILGAEERAVISLKNNINCDYGVGIEGGLFKSSNYYYLTAYAVIIDRKGNQGIGGAPVIKIPSSWEIKDNNTFEFGDYVDSISNRSNIKQNEGAMGYLTENKLERKDALKFAIICAYYSLKSDLSTRKQ